MRSIVTTLLVIVLLHCSGGGSAGPSGGGGSSSNIVGSFTPSLAVPTAGDIVLNESTKSGNMVTVEVRLTGITGVRSAEFDLLFDPAQLEFVGDAPGTAFETSGSPVIYVAGANTRGVLTVAVDIAGPGTVNVGQTRALIGLIFRVRQTGTHAVSFQDPRLRDGAFQTIPTQWFAGNFVGI